MTATDPIPGTFAWAIAQAGAGKAIRRASWPFYWFLTPAIVKPPSPEDPTIDVALRYTAIIAGDGPLGSCAVGQSLIHYPIPTPTAVISPIPEHLPGFRKVVAFIPEVG